MIDRSIPIPDHFSKALRVVASKDSRSDEEILQSIDAFHSVDSEKNIWAFWHAGLNAMPAWCKRNIVGWARLCGSSWTIRVLDHVLDSPNYILKHLSAENLPETFIQRTMTGPWIGQHSSDFVCGAALSEHGGVYMDVGTFLIRDLDALCWNKLSDPKCQYNVAAPWISGTIIANCWFAARRNDPFIVRWHKLFLHLWRDKRSPIGVVDTPLVDEISEYVVLDTLKRIGIVLKPGGERPPGDYLAQIAAWVRLTRIKNCKDEEQFNGVQYWKDHILLFDSMTDIWMAETEISWTQPKLILEYLTTPRSSTGIVAEKAAHAIWKMLCNASMEKVMHGPGRKSPDAKSLGLMLDAASENLESREGTFGELLRYGCVHFEQMGVPNYVRAPEPEELLDEGLFGQ